MEKLDVRKLDLKQTNEVCDLMNTDGEWCIGGGNIKRWDNVIELELINDYQHKYFLVWDNNHPPRLRRIRK